jgi:hypothetical protein
MWSLWLYLNQTRASSFTLQRSAWCRTVMFSDRDRVKYSRSRQHCTMIETSLASYGSNQQCSDLMSWLIVRRGLSITFCGLRYCKKECASIVRWKNDLFHNNQFHLKQKSPMHCKLNPIIITGILCKRHLPFDECMIRNVHWYHRWCVCMLYAGKAG